MLSEEIIEQLEKCKQEPVAQGTSYVDTVLKVLAIDQAIQIIRSKPQPELKTVDGIRYPADLDQMTFTHQLSVDERHDITQAYLIGFNSGYATCKQDLQEASNG